MKLTDKRFWSGDKTDYYSFFKYALSDSVLFSISWTLAISLILCLILLIIGCIMRKASLGTQFRLV